MSIDEKINKEEETLFDKIIIKILSFLKLSSGTGLMGLGGFWFLYGLIQCTFIKPENIYQQQIIETFFLEAEIGIIIVGIGIIIRILREKKS